MSQVQEIKDRLNIVNIVGDKVSLQKSGKNYRGLCPFHSEKTPSFFVSSELQSYKCFGCGRQGDIFTFLQEYDRLTFREALELLAKQAGVELEDSQFDPKEKMRRRVLEALDISAKFYRYLLTEHQIGQAGRDYLEQRKTSKSVQKNFQLGFAPAGWEQLSSYLIHKKNFTPKELVEAGLAIEGRRGRLYDRFRNRLVFPLHDHRGRVVGFSGRTLEKNTKEAKYINTPETMVYHKRFLLYGYHQNLNAIREKEAVIITEGEFDVLSSVQAHVKHVVAIKGSSLTAQQVRLLSRTVKTIYLALDADAAGVKATQRAFEVIQGFPITLRIIPLTGGKDPDELSRQDPAAWRNTTKNHIAAFDYLLNHAQEKYDTNSVAGQRDIADEMLQLILDIEHPVERNFYLQKLSESLNQSTHVLEEQLNRLQQKQQLKKIHSQADDDDKPKPLNGEDQLGTYLWQLALRTKQPTVMMKELTKIKYEALALERLRQELAKYLEKYDHFKLKQFSQQLPAQLQEILPQLYLQELPLEEPDLQKEWIKSLRRAQKRQKDKRRQEIQKRLREFDSMEKLNADQQQEQQSLLQEFSQLASLQNDEGTV